MKVKTAVHRNGKNPKQNTGRGNPNLRPGNPGNRGGKAGRSGRKSVAFKETCKALANGIVLAKVQAYLEQAKINPADPAWRWCADYVTNYGEGKPTQPVSGDDTAAPITVRVVYEDRPMVIDYDSGD